MKKIKKEQFIENHSSVSEETSEYVYDNSEHMNKDELYKIAKKVMYKLKNDYFNAIDEAECVLDENYYSGYYDGVRKCIDILNCIEKLSKELNIK